MKLLLTIIAVLATLGLILNIRVAEATREQHIEVCFCHNVNHNPHTICTDDDGKINGHNNHVNNGEDYLGECEEEPTGVPATQGVTPTVIDATGTPSATLTPTIYEPSNTPTQTVSQTVTPSVAQVPSATPTPGVSQEKWEEVRRQEGSVFGANK